MAAPIEDVKKFYSMIKDDTYPKNGSWKEAPSLKNLVSAYVITFLLLECVIALAKVPL